MFTRRASLMPILAVTLVLIKKVSSYRKGGMGGGVVLYAFEFLHAMGHMHPGVSNLER